jgi:hypothetical protein
VKVNLQSTTFLYVMAHPISGFPLYPLSSDASELTCRTLLKPQLGQILLKTGGLQHAHCDEMHVYDLTRQSGLVWSVGKGPPGAIVASENTPSLLLRAKTTPVKQSIWFPFVTSVTRPLDQTGRQRFCHHDQQHHHGRNQGGCLSSCDQEFVHLCTLPGFLMR